MTLHTAARVPVHRGPAAWRAILPDQPGYAPLGQNRTADFVIVGAGFAGLATARRLTQLAPQAKVVLLEAGAIAEGAAGRNSGFMIDLPHELNSTDYKAGGDEAAQTAMNRQAIAFAGGAAAEYAIPNAYFDPVGKVNGAVGASAHAHNLTYAARLKTKGERHELLDKAAMADLTGSVKYHSGLFTPGTVMLQPAGFVQGLAKGLSDHIAVHEQSPVTALTRAGADWQITTPKATVTTPHVILATNGHMESFGFAKGRLMHIFLFASMTPDLAAGVLTGADRWGVTPADPMGTTLRRIDTPQGGNRIVTRTCAVLRSGMETSAADLARATRAHRHKFDAHFPKLAGLAPEYSWAGHLCLSLNSVSVTEELEPGLFSACVQNGLGTARGTLTGIAAAEMACGMQSDITRFFANEEAPKRLPPRPLRDIGANAVLRWKERRAGAE